MARKQNETGPKAAGGDPIASIKYPAKRKWDKLARALGDRGIIEEDAFSALSGLTSLPFPRPAQLKKGEKWRVAVKVIAPKSKEGMRVVEMN